MIICLRLDHDTDSLIFFIFFIWFVSADVQVNFLSQLRLSHKGDGPKAAKRLIDIYFDLFKVVLIDLICIVFIYPSVLLCM